MRVWNTVFDLLPIGVDWPAPAAAERLESFFNLVPCPAVVSEDPFDLRLWAHVLESLELDASPDEKGGWPAGRVLVTPGWDSEPEWVVSIYQPRDGDAVVEVVEASTGITAEAYDLEPVSDEALGSYEYRLRPDAPAVPIKTHRRAVARPMAEAISSTLFEAIATADYSTDTIVLHPTTFYFMTWKAGVGDICAYAESPPPASLGGHLEELTHQLARYARGVSDPAGLLSHLANVRNAMETPGTCPSNTSPSSQHDELGPANDGERGRAHPGTLRSPEDGP